MFEGVMFTRPWTSGELFNKARRWQITFFVSFFMMAAIALIAPTFGSIGDAAIWLFFAFFSLAAVAVMMDDRLTTMARIVLSKEQRKK